MKLGLVLSNDWEVFGDGSGDYFEVQHKPLEAMLRTAEDHGAKVSVMAEVGQQWAHQHLSEHHPWAGEIAEAWESILRETIQRKSDVQLHLHPQWLNARYENGAWKLDYSRLSVASLPESDITRVLENGKRYLERLLRPIDPTYACVAFRAGAYLIEPSAPVIQALTQAGIACDSSVTRGWSNPPHYDFRDACSNFEPWFVQPTDIKRRSERNDGILEMPICSWQVLDSSLLRKLLPLRITCPVLFRALIDSKDSAWLAKQKRFNRLRYPQSRKPITDRKPTSAGWWASRIVGRRSYQLDYDQLPPKVFVKWLQRVFEKLDATAASGEQAIMPVVASGHVKRMHNCDNLGRILDEIDKHMRGKVIHWTLRKAVDYWRHNKLELGPR